MILFRTICFTLIFICYYGYAAAQEHEPDFRIDIRTIGISSTPSDIQFSRNGDYLFVFDSDGTGLVHRYDLENRRFDYSLLLPDSCISFSTPNSDGTKLACFGYLEDWEGEEYLQIIDFVSGDVLYTWSAPAESIVLTLYSPAPIRTSLYTYLLNGTSYRLRREYGMLHQ